MSENKFNILSLEVYLIKLLEDADNLHQASLREYPKDLYRVYDSRSIELRQLHIVLSNFKALKYVELGIADLDKEIDYLNIRRRELEDFYCLADGDDVSAISNGIVDIQKLLLDLKKKRSNLVQLEFELPKIIDIKSNLLYN